MQEIELVRQKAEEVFGDKAKAALWLSTPRHFFNGMTAIDFLKGGGNSQRVIDVLAQIEHGYAC